MKQMTKLSRCQRSLQTLHRNVIALQVPRPLPFLGNVHKVQQGSASPDRERPAGDIPDVSASA